VCKYRRIIYGLSAILAVVLLGLVCYRVTGLYVEVINNTPRRITDITLAYSGNTLRLAELPAHSTYKKRFKPKSESGVTLTWTDASGREHQQAVAGYLEPGYRGCITVTINGHNDVTVMDTTGIGSI
jgi:hypothetical protein